ncbi:T9SS type A sorting domain-containing protein [Aquimarina brevivitae]|uniref:Putative secreted protein (Por secretion system target) n=1 Tax=Aquimarina brevivitae TaxID=323412 RepID=A0A4Q7PFV3_9FLAO|nr:T9SS type A sorting domain-containing protein [Aquimarina brevivitae]RZS99361.1 putative secreted protein (Por secretion system target) [Aquimarina brevivitae]
MKNSLLTLIAVFFCIFVGIAQEYGVRNYSKTFRDSDRNNRRVNTRIYYPESTADVKFPVIVLGHGFIMGSDAYENFYEELVPRGYIVAFVNTEGSFFANHRAYAEDMAFIVSAMQSENSNTSSALFGKVANKTALMGHSMGGGAATVAASLVDVETLISFAPALLRFDTLTPASEVTTDAIVFSGSGDGVTPADENHIPIFNNLGSACKYFINIIGGAHCYYANSNWACDFGERSSSGNIQISRTEQQEIIFKYVNSWLDYKLKGDSAALQTFTSDLSSSQRVTYDDNCQEDVVETDEEVVLFPNPASFSVSIENKNLSQELQKIEFYNEQGALMYTSSTKTVNVSSFKKGLYIVKIYQKGKTITKRMIVD